MELVPYRSLRDVVQEDGPLAPDQATGWAWGFSPGCAPPTPRASCTAT